MAEGDASWDAINTTILSENEQVVLKVLEESLATIGLEIRCEAELRNKTQVPKDDQPSCNVTWDGLSCWPGVSAGTVAKIPCFGEFNGVLYDTSENASKICYENGTWRERSDYSSCRPFPHEEGLLKVLWDTKEAGTIYYIGYGISLVALIAALTIFFYFKNLRCLRNNIHTNLLTTYLLLDLTWIITATLQSIPTAAGAKVTCLLVICLIYLMGTNFFWMFVEGMYLYILAVNTFSIEVLRMPVYALIGWGLPALIVVTWTMAKAYFAPLSNDPLNQSCIWQAKDFTDYIFIAPVIVVLLINIFFLVRIMWVLLTKLRIANSAESKQYRKAAKALLVLIPLLGITYVLVIVTPSHRTARVIISYAQAVLLSTQGFTVAVLYCFLNGEVQKSVRHLWKRWTTRRTVHGSQRYSVSYRSSQYGENSMKIYRNRGVGRTRSSCASFTTTTITSLGNNWNSCHKVGCD